MSICQFPINDFLGYRDTPIKCAISFITQHFMFDIVIY